MSKTQFRNEKIVLSEIEALHESRTSLGKHISELVKDLSALKRQVEQKEKYLEIRKIWLEDNYAQSRKKYQEIESLPFELTKFGMEVES